MRIQTATLALLALLGVACNAPDGTKPDGNQNAGGQTDDSDTKPDDSGGQTVQVNASIVAVLPSGITADMVGLSYEDDSDPNEVRHNIGCKADNATTKCEATELPPAVYNVYGGGGTVLLRNDFGLEVDRGDVATLTYTELGDYGIDLNGEYESDGEYYEVATVYTDQKVTLTGLGAGFGAISMQGNNLQLDLGDGYIVTGVVSQDHSNIHIDVTHNDAIVESHDYNLE